MAKRGPYTPRSGPLVGITFSTEYRYRNARAQAMGFKSYYYQRQVTEVSLVRTIANRLQYGPPQMSRFEAQRAASDWWQGQRYKGRTAPPLSTHSPAQGARKRDAIRMLMESGAYATPEEAVDEIPY